MKSNGDTMEEKEKNSDDKIPVEVVQKKLDSGSLSHIYLLIIILVVLITAYKLGKYVITFLQIYVHLFFKFNFYQEFIMKKKFLALALFLGVSLASISSFAASSCNCGCGGSCNSECSESDCNC